MSVRRASHANSWYSGNGQQLDRDLTSWLSAADQLGHPARAVICPHAGYSYSGPTAAYSFKQLDPNTVKTIFILGPSHHVRLSSCALTQCATYQTPLGDLTINREITKQLLDTGKFELMSIDADEDEHSIEMQLPYIAKVMKADYYLPFSYNFAEVGDIIISNLMSRDSIKVVQVMESARGSFTIVPVMVGSLSPNSEAKYGKIFARYLQVCN